MDMDAAAYLADQYLYDWQVSDPFHQAQEKAEAEFWAREDERRLEEEYSWYLSDCLDNGEDALSFEDWVIHQAEISEPKEW